LAPEHAFPLPLHDVLQGYLRLLQPPLSIAPEDIIVAGDSAGGGLSLALCMYLRDEGYEMPSGLILMSPWVDLTMSCGSWDENADTDVVPRPDSDGKPSLYPVVLDIVNLSRPFESCGVLPRAKRHCKVPNAPIRVAPVW